MSDIMKYGGTWKLFEKDIEYKGELHIDNENHTIILEVLLPASEAEPMPRIPYIGKIPFINGTLFFGAKVLLYDCITEKENNHISQYTQQIIYANYAFWGLNTDDELLLSKALFDFGDIIEWSGLCQFKLNFDHEGIINIMWNKNEPIKYKLNENLQITFYPNQGKNDGDLFDRNITIKQQVWVEFSYITPTKVSEMMDDVLCIQYLIGIGLHRKVEINEAKFYHPSLYVNWHNVSGALDGEIQEDIYISSDLLLGTGKTISNIKRRPYDYLFTLREIHQLNLFTKWRDNYYVLKPILDLYFTAFSPTSSTMELLFINLTQALETYHARFFADDKKTYVDRVDSYTRNYYTHYNQTKVDKSFSKKELPIINSQLLALLEYHLLVLLGYDALEAKKKIIVKINRITDYYELHKTIHEI